MSQEIDIQKVIQGVLSALNNPMAANNAASGSTNGGKLTVQDYPLAEKRPDLVRTPTGKALDELTLEKLCKGEVTGEDMRIAPQTLEMQAQISEAAGRAPLARNMRRAAELIAIPDERVLEIYNALRPNRSTKEELLAIADELENKYNAKINAGFVREAAEVYATRDMLRKNN
ncbi:diol dehydratase small subunit [Neisseria sp. Ec49-e6-T10]|uniref:diol dehydratase small subunit n=1 Tax=Neisseria sp. Ec49-e6-T10 TaxID=3140744 RepID=UPI003EB9FCC9